MKACILAAGEGKRLAPLTETRPKHMIHIAGRPLLQHTLEMLKANKITDILLVIGYLKEKIQNYFGDGKQFGLNIQYIEQKEFLGTAHAAALAKEFAQNDFLMLIYGDLFMDSGVFQKSINTLTMNGVDGTIAAISVMDPTKFGILKTDSMGYLEKVVEKPLDDRYGKLANAGVYIFPPEIFEGIKHTPKSVRNEYELTDSIQYIIDHGKKLKVVDISDFYWSDVGHPWQLLDANHHMLSQLQPKENNSYPNAVIEDFVHIKGAVVVGNNTIIKSGTYIEGPVFIGDNCSIGPQAYIRPNSSIGNNCHIGNSSEIKASIIMDNVNIAHLSYVGDSIIGESVNLGCGAITANVRLDKQPIIMNIKGARVQTGLKKMGAVIGDGASLGIQVSIMPGKTIGSYAQVGANTIITEDIPQNSCVYVKQTLFFKKDLKKK